MILVTGGTGFIGSHVCLELLMSGRAVVVLDNLSNSSPTSIRRVERICGQPIIFHEADVRDQAAVEAILKTHDIEAVVHLAGLKSVKDSVEKPLDYYDCNVVGAMRLIAAMSNAGVKTIVFSSSATVYGIPQALPLTERHALAPMNPYGRTKLVVEQLLADQAAADPDWRVGVLRYFNPIGAHDSGLIGEDPVGTPNNLMPFVAQVAVGRRPHLNVWGDTFDTADGTGIRDYVHVVDLAAGHVRALDALARGSFTVNLGTGAGHSVLAMIRAFEQASGRTIPYVIGPRRDGDVAVCYADPTAAKTVLAWSAERDLAAMCRDQWRWQTRNPDGYRAL